MDTFLHDDQVKLSIKTLCDVIDGYAHHANQELIALDVCIDTRHLHAGQMFWALPGQHHDGHQFLEQAIERGASQLVVERLPQPVVRPYIQVKDTLTALGKLAAWYRRHYYQHVIGITGSVGKTTTRQLIHHLLTLQHSVWQSPQNFNNHLGVPLSLLGIKPAHDLAIIELGTSSPGEIATLSEIASPDIGVLTSVAPAHLEDLHSIEGVLAEKCDLLRSLPSDGLAIVNGDQDWSVTISEELSCRVISVGQSPHCQWRAEHVSIVEEGLSFTLDGDQYLAPFFSQDYLINVLIAIGLAREWGLECSQVQHRLREFELPDGRGNVKDLAACRIIDETYNANPTSVGAAIHSLEQRHVDGRRLAILGDMLGLGIQAERYHEELGEIIAQCGLDLVIYLGDQQSSVLRGYIHHRLSTSPELHLLNLGNIGDSLKSLWQEGDTILVKGSRGMRMERIIKLLIDQVG